MFEEKYYTISDIAKLTRLTDRTIRNYLANGSLNGKKVGGQWRFTKDDIKSLFSDNKFEDDMKNKTEKSIHSYYNNQLEFLDNNKCCQIIDVIIESKEERMKMFAEIKQLNKSTDEKENITFIYEKKYIRMIIISSFDYVYKVMSIVRRYI